MIDPTTAAGAAGAAAAKGASSIAASSIRKSESVHSALVEEMKSTQGFRGAAEHKANRLEMKEGIFNWLLTPLFWLSKRQTSYYAEDFADDMAEKLAGIADEDIVSPDPNVGVQAMEGLAYSLDSPALKDMYLTLLATAADVNHRDEAHPSFASIIRQLSGSEAARLPDAINLDNFGAVANLMLTTEDNWQRYLERHVPHLDSDDTGELLVEPGFASMVDNWVRLGLVSVTYDKWATGEGAYDYVLERPEYLRWKDKYDGSDGLRIEVIPGLIYPTDFGRQFGRVVLGQPSS